MLTIAFSKNLYSQSYPRNENPNYMWTSLDEQFNTLSTSVWDISHNILREGWFIWVPGAPTVTCSNGKLFLSMHYSPGYTTTDQEGNPITADYIAGEVSTKQKFSYGIFECKATFAHEKGSFPAIWLYSDAHCSITARPEIDIVECKHERLFEPPLHNAIWYYPLNCQPQTCEFVHDKSSFSWGEPHTYKLVWTPSKIEFWVDNTLLTTVVESGQNWYPNLEQKLILSQQITKVLGGGDLIETPQTSSFDWVKVKEYFLAPEISCPDLICTTGTSVLDVDSKATNITWALTPANLFSGAKTGSGKTASITAASNVSGQGKITYTFTMPSGETFTAEKTFWVGKPGTPLTSPSGYPTLEISLGAFQPISLFKTPGFTGGTINWWSTGSIEPVGSTSNPTCSFEAVAPGTGNFYVTVQNTCGTSPTGGGTVNVVSGGGGQMMLVMTPNPTTGETTLSIETDDDMNAFDETVEWDLEVYDQSQSLKEKKNRLKGKSSTIQTAGWKEGIYAVRVKYKDRILQEKLVVQK